MGLSRFELESPLPESGRIPSYPIAPMKLFLSVFKYKNVRYQVTTNKYPKVFLNPYVKHKNPYQSDRCTG